MPASISMNAEAVAHYCVQEPRRSVVAFSVATVPCRVPQRSRGAVVAKRHRGAGASAGAAIGLSGLASFIGLCCVGPWAVALLGISGAIAMAEWQPYRPYILAVAAVALAWGFWRVYRPRPSCEDDSCPPQPSVWLQTALWLALVMVVLAFFAEQLQWLLFDPTPEALKP